MITEVYLAGTRVKLDPARAIGKGGEADVYDAGGRALKVWKSPDHPDYDGLPGEQRAAESRLASHQKKLRQFPSGLPREVVGPEALATDKSGRTILGYAMPLVVGAEPLLRLSEPAFRRARVSSSEVVRFFLELWGVVRGLHACGVVLGDFNDLNVLVTADGHPRVIDADSFQFGPFPCAVYTQRFVDPLLCDPAAASLVLEKPYDAAADWYAFSVLLFQSLLLVGPYGGVHRPRHAGVARLEQAARPLRRVTVFDPDVVYPRPAIGYRVLPDPLLHHFHGLLERDERGVFPRALLESLTFTRCASCGVEHAHSVCPLCAVRAATAVPSRVSGACAARLVFSTDGVILDVALDGDTLRVLHHDVGAFRREDRAVVLEGPLDRRIHGRVAGARSVFARDGQLVVLSPGESPRRFPVDAVAGSPAFDARGEHVTWVSEGELRRDAWSLGAWDSVRIGDALARQTRVWVGPSFGLGFYRAGALSRVFVFDAVHAGVNDEPRLPPVAGQVIDAGCVLDEGRAWLFLATQTAGQIEHLCLVYSRQGALEASAKATRGDGSWLGSLMGACRGACATAGVLLAPTDAGIVRVEVDAGSLRVARTFDETAPFVDASSRLIAHPRGVYVASSCQIHQLSLGHSRP